MPRRPTKRPPNLDVVEMLERWLMSAYSGDLRDLVIVGRFADGSYTDEWDVDDLGDMVLELRSTVIRAQTQADEPEPAVH